MKLLKRIIPVLVLIHICTVCHAQSENGISIGGDTLPPHPSALLELKSNSKGFLPTRLSTEQRESIGSPASGLLVYDTTLNKLFYFSSEWKPFIDESSTLFNNTLSDVFEFNIEEISVTMNATASGNSEFGLYNVDYIPEDSMIATQLNFGFTGMMFDLDSGITSGMARGMGLLRMNSDQDSISELFLGIINLPQNYHSAITNTGEGISIAYGTIFGFGEKSELDVRDEFISLSALKEDSVSEFYAAMSADHANENIELFLGKELIEENIQTNAGVKLANNYLDAYKNFNYDSGDLTNISATFSLDSVRSRLGYQRNYNDSKYANASLGLETNEFRLAEAKLFVSQNYDTTDFNSTFSVNEKGIDVVTYNTGENFNSMFRAGKDFNYFTWPLEGGASSGIYLNDLGFAISKSNGSAPPEPYFNQSFAIGSSYSGTYLSHSRDSLNNYELSTLSVNKSNFSYQLTNSNEQDSIDVLSDLKIDSLYNFNTFLSDGQYSNFEIGKYSSGFWNAYAGGIGSGLYAGKTMSHMSYSTNSGSKSNFLKIDSTSLRLEGTDSLKSVFLDVSLSSGITLKTNDSTSYSHGVVINNQNNDNLFILQNTGITYIKNNLGIGISAPSEKLEIDGRIKTAQPSGNGSGAWKLGKKVTATVSLVTSEYIEVEIDGVVYKLALVN